MFRIRRQLRSNDFDFLGHLNQSLYHIVLEDARLAFVHSRVPTDFRFVIARTELDHLAEVPMGNEELEVEIELGRVGNSSFSLNQRVLRLDGVLAARGVATFVRWDPENRCSQPLSESEREALSKNLTSSS